MKSLLAAVFCLILINKIITQAPPDPALPPAVVPIPDTNSIKECNTQVMSTNFTVPIIRFNPIDKNSANAPTGRKGNVTFLIQSGQVWDIIGSDLRR